MNKLLVVNNYMDLKICFNDNPQQIAVKQKLKRTICKVYFIVWIVVKLTLSKMKYDSVYT
jgi:hypothetical protein